MTQESRKKLEASSWVAVVSAYQACARRYAQMLMHFDLTIAQFDVLSAIRKYGEDATPKAIANELLVTRGNITGLVNRLAERDLIRTRQHATDGRSFCCELTESGHRLLAEARVAAQRFIGLQLSIFDDEELTVSRDLMTRMRSKLETMDPDTIAAGDGEHTNDSQWTRQ